MEEAKGRLKSIYGLQVYVAARSQGSEQNFVFNGLSPATHRRRSRLCRKCTLGQSQVSATPPAYSMGVLEEVRGSSWQEVPAGQLWTQMGKQPSWPDSGS